MDEQDDQRSPEGAWSDDDVRRLLADAHHSGEGRAGEPGDDARLPDDVAARLDDVLAGLVAERAAEPDEVRDAPSGVTSIEDARRGRSRRRAWTTAAGVAAALVVGGTVLGATVLPGLTGSDSADQMSTTAEMDSGDSAGDSAGAEEDAGRALTAESLPSRAPTVGAPRISSARLEPDVRAFLSGVTPVAAAADSSAYSSDEPEELFPGRTAATASAAPLTESRARALLGCSVPDALSYAVAYDDRAAQAVVEETPAEASGKGSGEEASQVVRVFVCDASGDAVEVNRVTVATTP